MLRSQYRKYTEHYIKNTSIENRNPLFIKWMDTVEKKFHKKYNMNLLDIPDQLYMHYFENGLTSNDMLRIIEAEVINN